jgi:transposase
VSQRRRNAQNDMHRVARKCNVKTSRKHDPVATQQKTSGRLRSDKAARDRYAVRGYASTAGKHGADALTAIPNALAGNPCMAPVPAVA